MDMSTFRILTTAAAALATAGLAGCQMGPSAPRGPIMAVPQPAGIDGSWIDEQGTGLTVFTAGQFQTFATDTGQKLSEGSYNMTSPTLVEISGISIVRQSPVAFNCAMATQVQLNCTASSGQQFVLTRRTGVS